jgi:hypothetical protein
MRTKTSRGLSVAFVVGMLTLGVASQAMAGPTTDDRDRHRDGRIAIDHRP